MELLKYLDIMSKLNKVTMKNCGQHPNVVTKNYCPICVQWICGECEETHQYFNHFFHKTEIEIILGCKKHHRELTTYCIDCDEVMCERCSLNHLHHEIARGLFEETPDNFPPWYKTKQNALLLRNKEYFDLFSSSINHNDPQHIQYSININQAYQQNRIINAQLELFFNSLLKTFEVFKYNNIYTLYESISHIKIPKSSFKPSEYSTDNIQEWYELLMKYYSTAFILNIIPADNDEALLHVSPSVEVKNKPQGVTTIKLWKSSSLIELNMGYLVVSHSNYPEISLYNKQTFKRVRSGNILGESEILIRVTGFIQLQDRRFVTAHCKGLNRVWNLSLPDSELLVNTFISNNKDYLVKFLQLIDGRLVTWSKKWIAQIWNITSFECLKSVQIDILGKQLIDGSLLSVDYQGLFQFWNQDTFECFLSYKDSRISESAMELLDRRIVSWNSDGIIQFWTFEKKRMKQVYLVDAYQRPKTEFSSHFNVIQLTDGRLVSGGYNRVIQVWDVSSFECLVSFETQECISLLLELNDGRLASLSTYPHFTHDKSTYLQIWSL